MVYTLRKFFWSHQQNKSEICNYKNIDKGNFPRHSFLFRLKEIHLKCVIILRTFFNKHLYFLIEFLSATSGRLRRCPVTSGVIKHNLIGGSNKEREQVLDGRERRLWSTRSGLDKWRLQFLEMRRPGDSQSRINRETLFQPVLDSRRKVVDVITSCLTTKNYRTLLLRYAKEDIREELMLLISMRK